MFSRMKILEERGRGPAARTVAAATSYIPKQTLQDALHVKSEIDKQRANKAKAKKDNKSKSKPKAKPEPAGVSQEQFKALEDKLTKLVTDSATTLGEALDKFAPGKQGKIQA